MLNRHDHPARARAIAARGPFFDDLRFANVLGFTCVPQVFSPPTVSGRPRPRRVGTVAADRAATETVARPLVTPPESSEGSLFISLGTECKKRTHTCADMRVGAHLSLRTLRKLRLDGCVCPVRTLAACYAASLDFVRAFTRACSMLVTLPPNDCTSAACVFAAAGSPARGAAAGVGG